MDSAKAKYIEFFPHCMRVLKTGGVLVVDDIFQGGTIYKMRVNPNEKFEKFIAV